MKFELKVFFFVIMALFPLVVSNYNYSSDIFLSILIYIFLILLPILFLNKSLSKNHGNVDVSFWTYVYLFIGISSLIQINENQIPWISFVSYSSEIFIAIFIFIVGIISYIIGRYSNIDLNFPIREISLRRTNYLLIFSFFMLICLLASMGFESIIFPRVIFDVSRRELPFIIKLFHTFLQVSLFICLISYFLLFKKKTISFNAIIPCLLICFIYFNPIRSDRLSFLILFTICFLYYFKSNRFLWMASLNSGLVLIFPYLDYFRESLDSSGYSKDLSFSFVDNFTSADFDAMTTMLLSIKYVQFNDLLFFKNVFLSFVGLIPRSFWPSKSYSTSFLLTENGNIEFSNIATNFWAEGFISLSYLGVIIFLFSLGVFFKNLLLYSLRSDFIKVIYIFFIPFTIFFLRGDLYASGFKIIPLIFFSYFITSKREKFI